MKKFTLCIGLFCSLNSFVSGQSNITLGNNVLFNNTTGSANIGIGNSVLYDNTTGGSNTAIGHSSLTNNITGNRNVAVGNQALHENTTGKYNTATGDRVLFYNTTGNYNIGIGNQALFYNTVGSGNIGIGYNALSDNTTANHNIGIGNYSLYNNTTGDNNISIGDHTLYFNTTGYNNIGIGEDALYRNGTGHDNFAIGISALYLNTTGSYNTVSGNLAMRDNGSGSYNTALGYTTLTNNVSGSYNVGLGNAALYNNGTGGRNTALGVAAARQNTSGYNSTAIGYDALRYNTTGTGNTALGYKSMATSAASTYSYSVALGAYSLPTASYQVRVGYFGTSSIGGSQNWTNLSDGRFKKEVEEDVMGLDFIKALRPVSYYVDNEAVNEFLGVELEKEAINNKKQYQTGFIAQEVEATAKELGFEHFGGVDVPVNDKSHYGLRYAEFVVPLVKSVQELSEQNEDLKALIATQQVQINELLEAKNANLNTAIISSQSQAVLYQNAPNPFSHETQIKLFVPVEVGQAFIQVCTIDGKQLFVKEVTGRSETSVILEAGDLSAGIYMYTLVVDNEMVDSKRMMLTK